MSKPDKLSPTAKFNAEVEELRSCLLELKRLYAWAIDVGFGIDGGQSEGGKVTVQVSYSDPASTIALDRRKQALRAQALRTAKALRVAHTLLGNQESLLLKVTQDPGVLQPTRPSRDAVITEQELQEAFEQRRQREGTG